MITDAFGLVSTHIGTDPTNAYSNTFGDIDWDGFSKKLITRIDFTNTGDQFEPHHEMDLIFIPGSGGSGGSAAIVGTTPPNDGVDDPVDPTPGAIYVDSTTGDLYVFDGTNWVKPNSTPDDTTAPLVTGVSMSATDALGAVTTDPLETGDVILVTLAMSEVVMIDTAGGVPTYTFDVGGAPRTATYVSGSGSTDLVFAYTVNDGDLDNAGGVTATAGSTAFDLAGATLSDAAGNAANVSTPAVVAGDNTIVVDAAGPIITNVTIKGTDGLGTDKTTTLIAGDKIVVTLTLDGTTTVDTTGGVPTYTIDVGGVDKTATYVSGTGTAELVFSYTILAGDADTAGGITAGTSALALAGGTILGTADGKVVALVTPEIAAAANSIVIDATGPIVDSVSIKGTDVAGADKATALDTGDKLVVTLTMDEATTVDTAGGFPTYTIDVGGVSKTATYVSGTGTTELVFSYTIVSGDNDSAGGITAGTTALALAGGTLKDAAGNDATLATPEVAATINTVAVNTAGPIVDSVAIKGTDAAGADKTTALDTGDKLVVSVTMDEATTVTGTPTYTIDVGGVSKTATYVSGTGTTELVFSYTIVAGDNDNADGITAGTTALTLAGGTLKDAAGNDATLATPEVTAADNAVAVDTVDPTVSSVAIKGTDAAGADKTAILVEGDKIVVTATMSEATTVTGTPTYTIDVGGVSKTATYVSGTGTTELVFSYTIVDGDADATDGITAGTTALALAGGTLKDAAGKDAVLTTPEVAAADNAVAVDAADLAVSSVAIKGTDAAGADKATTLVAGDKIVVAVTMNKATTVTGTPTYTIDVGGVAKTVTYVSGSGTTELVFSYTIVAGDNDSADGITAGTTALALAGGTLKDAAGNDAILTTPEVAAADNAVAVDTVVPTVTAVLITGEDSMNTPKTTTLGMNDNIVVTVTMSEATTITGAATYTIDVGGVSKTAAYVSGSGTTALKFSYTVAAGDADSADGITASTTALALVGGTLKDAAGNDAVLTTPEVATADNAVAVDTIAPTVSSVAISGTDSLNAPKTTTLVAGDNIVVNVSMSEAVIVVDTGGTPTYTIDVGGVSKSATYVSGSGTTALKFSYTIVAGDNDSADGITAGTTAITLNGGTLKDAAGNNANLATPAVAAADNAVAVDTAVPTVSSVAIKGTDAAGADKTTTLVVGDKIVVTATMSEATTVTGTPTYTIDVGGVSKTATYVSGSGTTNLVFSYTIAAGDTDAADGITAGTTALALGGGTLKDVTGNDAVITTPTVLAATNTIAVDTTVPTVTAVSITGADAANAAKGAVLIAGDKIVVNVTMSEATTVTGTANYTIDVGGVNRTATYASGSGTTSLVFRYTVVDGESDTAGGITASTTALTLAGGTLKDAAGNDATLTTPAVAVGTNTVEVLTILAAIGFDEEDGAATTTNATAAELNAIAGVTGAIAANETAYQAYINANGGNFSSPATAAEVQTMVTNVNAVESLALTLGAALEQGTASNGDIVASFTVNAPAVVGGFTPGTNADGYYTIVGTDIQLTTAGAAVVNGGGQLTDISLTATSGAATATDSARPAPAINAIISLGADDFSVSTIAGGVVPSGLFDGNFTDNAWSDPHKNGSINLNGAVKLDEIFFGRSGGPSGLNGTTMSFFTDSTQTMQIDISSLAATSPNLTASGLSVVLSGHGINGSGGNLRFDDLSSIADKVGSIRLQGSSTARIAFTELRLFYVTTESANVDGTDGVDMLTGTLENNEIFTGGAGDDTLTGGGGSDIFNYDALSGGSVALGNDTITDFVIDTNLGGDQLDLAGVLDYTAGSLAAYLAVTDNGADVVIAVDANGDGSGTDFTITLVGSGDGTVTLADLEAANSLLVL